MYELLTRNRNVKKRLETYIQTRGDVVEKLKRLRENPRRECGAHPLKGRLKGKWSCWIGSNIRAVYIIDDKNKSIILETIGTHKVY
jgi:addiction module RelE/StbE family toxin